MTVAQREGLARGREARLSRTRRGHVRPRHVTGLKGEEGIAVAGRLRRFLRAYDADPTTAGRVAVAQIMADLWDANTFLKPVWTTVRRIARRINALDLREPIEPPGNGEPSAEEIGALAGLNDLVPIMAELGRWFKKTTDVALRLGEISARIHGAGDDYLERLYGDDAPKRDEAAEIPPDIADAEVVEDERAPGDLSAAEEE